MNVTKNILQLAHLKRKQSCEYNPPAFQSIGLTAEKYTL